MIKKIACFVWLFIGFVAIPALSYADYRDDDSCVERLTIFDQIGQVATTLGVSEAISAAFRMVDTGSNAAGTEGEMVPNPNKPGEMIQRCHVPTDDVRFRYKSLTTNKTRQWRNGDSGFFDLIVHLKAAEVNDKICIKAFLGIAGYQVLGCKYRPDPAAVNFNTACFVSYSCVTRATSYSKSIFPLSASIVQCVYESLYNFFWNSQGQCPPGSDRLAGFQNGLRRAVLAALTLYVMFFFIRVMIGSELPRKGEVFMFIIKMVLVIYFSIGFTGSNPVPGRTFTGNGVGDIFQISTAAMASFSSMVLSAGQSSNICRYDITEYPSGWGMLNLWDALDCRVLFYLGMNQIAPEGQTIEAILNGDPAAALKVGAPRLLQYFFPSLFGFNLIFAVICLVLAIFILSVAVYIVHTYIIALIAVALVTYLAPLFVPMALFGPTKGYYQKWLSILMGYTFQPMVLFAFMGLMFTIFDEIMYPGCQFRKLQYDIPIPAGVTNVTISVNGTTPAGGGVLQRIPIFVMRDATVADPNWDRADQDRCKRSFGYFISRPGDFITVPALFFDLVIFPYYRIASFFSSLLSMVVFMFLFYYFVQMLSGLAMDLVGGTMLGSMAIAPTYIMDKAKELGEKVLDAKTGGAYSKAKAGAQAAKGGGAPDAGGVATRGGAGGGVDPGGGAGGGAGGLSNVGAPKAGGGGGGLPPAPKT